MILEVTEERRDMARHLEVAAVGLVYDKGNWMLVSLARKAGFGRRGSLVLLLLCVIVFAQVAALSSQFDQHGPSDHCCLLCHVGPLALLPTSIPVVLAPVAPAGWRAASPVAELAREMPLAASPSRAPPA